MSRRRLTWESPSRKASAPPATPGYEEPSNHPAAYPDPEADAYENGDTSAWAEDVHPGPYPNGAPPALPGTDAPQGHPATDLAHYFPNGAAKQASRQLRAALEAKAAKCIRLAARMLGKNASQEAIENQAIDLMTLTERQIQATLRRVAEEGGGTDILAFENMTLTPPRTGGEDDTEELLQAMLAEEDGSYEADDEEAMLASMLAEEQKRLASLKPSKKAGQNDPRATYKGKAAEKAEDEKPAKEATDSEEKEAEESDEDPAKKAAHFQRLAAYWSKKAKKAEADNEPEENEEEAEKDEEAEAASEKKAGELPEALKDNQFKAKGDKKDESKKDDKADKKAAFLRLASEFLSADLKETLAALVAEEEAPAEKSADDLLVDDLIEDPLLDGMGVGDDVDVDLDDLSNLYGMHTASEDSEETAEEEPAKEDKKAAVRPQPRRASTGVKALGAVAKVASAADANDLSKLWASSPDVSDVFGMK
jgi:hypothetical protein